MVSFELGKELRKMFFVLSRAWDKEKSGIEPQTFGSNALPLSQIDSTVSEV